LQKLNFNAIAIEYAYMSNELSIYDKQLSLQLAGGNADLASQMLSMFLKDLPKLRQQANDALAKGDNESLFQHVHKVNGATRYCGVPAIEHAANSLELLIRGNSDEMENSLESALSTLNTEIDKLINLMGSQ